MRTPVRVFGAYAVLLFTATHYPNLQVPGPVPRTDLFVHVGAFGCWMLAASWCAWFGPATSMRNVVRTWFIAVVYAGFDEGLQAIPALHRTCAWDDFGANVLGITLAGAAFWFVGKLRRCH